MNTRPYEVVIPLSNSGTRHEPGEVVELAPREAANLVNAGILLALDEQDAGARAPAAPSPPDPEDGIAALISECHGEAMLAIEALRRDVAALAATLTPRGGVDPSPGPEPGAGEPALVSAEDRALRIMEAIAELTPGRDDHWTRAGKPEVAALRTLTGISDLTGAERDAAWAAIQAAD